MGFTLSQLNQVDQAAFVRAVGSVFEQSPWVAEVAWAKKPFASVENLHRTLCDSVLGAGGERQLALISAHPDLAGHAALSGTLTLESSREQANAGLDRLSQPEISLFKTLNAAYRDKFGFPFVICARLSKKDAILMGFENRLRNSREQEIQIALEEIFKIAEFRLRDLISS